MEDQVFQSAFTRFRNEINVTTLIKEMRVIKAAVQSKLTHQEWKEVKKTYAIKPLWVKEKVKSTEDTASNLKRRRKGISLARVNPS